MKNSILIKCFFVSITILEIVNVNAQSDKTAYAVTDSIRNGVRWNFLRTVNLSTGIYGGTITSLLTTNDTPLVSNPVLVNGVAAIAFDKRSKRVYFAPMLLDRLSYVDLRTMNKVVVKNNFTGLMPKLADQSNVITRMVINEEGIGYALTNDGKHLIRFKTNNNNVVDFGSLIDAQSNGENSIHNSCSSFGGDIIADEEDNLYLITFRNLVYKIKLENRVAKYLGHIQGLPANFSTSGAAVDQSGKKIILVSSIDASAVYSLNLNSLMANAVQNSNAWHAADLGGSGVLKKNRDRDDENESRLITYTSLANDKIQLYPNPVTDNEFRIKFSDIEAGSYTLQVIDMRGQLSITKIFNIGGKNSIMPVSLPSQLARGVYFVRVVDKNSKMIFNEKIILQ